MKNIINKLFNNRYFVAILGLLLISYYLWYRFIRERLPKQIPFDLSLFNTCLILYICIGYFYVIYRIIKPKEPNILISYLYKILYKLTILFSNLDDIIKENNVLNKTWDFLLIKISENLNTKTLYYKKIQKYFTYIFLPKLVLISILIIDIFWFKELNLFYSFIILGIIPLMISYFIYSLKLLQIKYITKLKNYFIEIISEDDDPNTDYYLPPSTISYDDYSEIEYDLRYKYLNIQHFIDLQSSAIKFQDTPYRYKCLHINKRKDIINVYSTENVIDENVEYYLLVILDIQIILDSYKDVQQTSFIYKLNIGFLSLHLICWSYILFISLTYFHLTLLDIIFLQNFQENFEPFSETILSKNE